MCVVLLITVMIGISWGAVALPLSSVWQVVGSHVLGDLVSSGASGSDDRIIWEFRVPRALLGVVVGAGLAVVGTALQVTVRNQLADPFILGVTSGASFGAVLVLVLGSAALGGLGLSTAAFVGAVTTLLGVYLLARQEGRASPARLILAGVALSYLFSAGTSFLVFYNSDNPYIANTVLFWLLGSLAAADWSDLALPAAVVLAGTAWLLVQARNLNSLMLGDEAAASLGVDVERLRLKIVVVSSLMVGATVAVSGSIGFVGLMIPHIVRLIVGADHRRVLPIAALVGGAFLVWVDLASRTVLSPAELPVSIATAAVGAPFFLWLMYRRNRPGSEAIA